MAIFKDSEGEMVEIPDDYDVKTGENKAYKVAEALGKRTGFPLTMENEVIPMDVKEEGKFEYVPRAQVAQRLKEGWETPELYNSRKTANETFGQYVKPESFDKSDSFQTGIASGASLGFTPALAGIQHAITNKQKDESILDAYRRGREGYKAYERSAAEQNPYSYGAGQVTGGVGTGIATAGVPVIGAAAGGLSGLVRSGAVMGGLAGAGNSNADLTKGEFSKFGNDVLQDTALGGALGGAAHYIPELGKGAVRQVKELSKRFTPKQAKPAFSLGKNEGVNYAATEALPATENELLGMGTRFKEAANDIRKSEGAKMGEALTPETAGTFPKPIAKENLPSTPEELALIEKSENLSGKAKDIVNDKIGRLRDERYTNQTQGYGPVIQAYKEIGKTRSALKNMLAIGGDTDYVLSLTKGLDDLKGLRRSLEKGTGSLEDVENVRRRVGDLLKGKINSGDMTDVKIRTPLMEMEKNLNKAIGNYSPDFEKSKNNYRNIMKWLKPKDAKFPKTSDFKTEAQLAMAGKPMPATTGENLSQFREGLENLKNTLPEEQANILKNLQAEEALKQQQFAIANQGQGLKGIPTYAAGEAGIVAGTLAKDVKSLIGDPIGDTIIKAASKSADFAKKYVPLFVNAAKRNGSVSMIALDGYLMKNDPVYREMKRQQQEIMDAPL